MGIEANRRGQLVRAAIEEIGAAGSAQVTVSQIAKRAGVSSALAFHYFGDKEQLFLGAMREVLRIYRAEVLEALARADGPQARVDAVIRASFAASNFEPNVVSAWLVFYVTAQQSDAASRLLGIYRRRLHSTLLHSLRAMGLPQPEQRAEGIGALIDGLYLRQALRHGDGADAIALVRDYALREGGG